MKKIKLLRLFLLLFLISVSVLVYRFNEEDWHKNALPEEGLYFLDWIPQALSIDEEKTFNEAINQPFYYLGEGGQSYVFRSEDQKYVLKFFKFHRFRAPWFVSYLPSLAFFDEIKEKSISKREKRLVKVLRGHQVAYEYIRNEAGLAFVQLTPDNSEKKVLIFDKKGKEKLVDLGRMPFILQEKGEPLNVVFSRLLDQGLVEAMKEKIDRIFAFYLGNYRKGVMDEDHGIMHNLGFLGDRPIHLDAGEFIQDERIKQKELIEIEMHIIAQKMSVWVEKKYPQYAREISLHIQDQLKLIN